VNDPNETNINDEEPDARNPWARISLGLVAAALVVGFLLTVVPGGPLGSASLGVLILIASSMIVSGVGWAYVEIRHQERISQAAQSRRGQGPPSDARRILGYIGTLVVVASIAVAGSMVPSRLAPIIWSVYIPIALVGGWWVRTRRKRRLPHNRRSH
jgi:uncharacterized membrane protein YidH (DUF202 family)